MWNLKIVLDPGSKTAGFATAADQETGFAFAGAVDTADPVSLAAFAQAAQAAVAASVWQAANTLVAQAALAQIFDGLPPTPNVAAAIGATAPKGK